MNQKQMNKKRIAFYKSFGNRMGTGVPCHKSGATYEDVILARMGGSFRWYESEDINMKEIWLNNELVAILPNDECYDRETGENWLHAKDHIEIDQ